jgi:hypothetical protein
LLLAEYHVGVSDGLFESEIRREIAAIFDQLDSLPKDAIEERSRLTARKDELRVELRRFNAADSAAITDAWSERAASKPVEDSGKPFIPSPGEGGQAGGG